MRASPSLRCAGLRFGSALNSSVSEAVVAVSASSIFACAKGLGEFQHN